MSAFADASAEESRRIMEDFLAEVFADHADDPFAATMGAALPRLGEDPTAAQVDAWIELAALVGDAGFRARVRHMVAEGSRLRASRGISAVDPATQEAGHAVVERAGAAVAGNLAPGAPEAAPIVTELVAGFAAAAGRSDDAAYRAELADQLVTFNDRRVERYWQLIGLINGWPRVPSMLPAYEWFLSALRAAA